MNPFSAIARHCRRRKLIALEVKVAGLTAALRRTEQLAKICNGPKPHLDAIHITQKLWENKRHLQILSEQQTTC
jgi:hypothetical protein